MKIITLEQVSKRYRLSRLGARSIREALAGSAGRLLLRERGPQASEDDFFALRNVSFAVEQGEAVGIIGPNGSGKSTVLKLLARITYPTSGKIRVLGSVASLIEVGAGFHPELTGRENVFLYGSIMGMRRSEVQAKFDYIVDFAELHAFIDVPIKRYSSGMYVRLGFAVAAHINPCVLLVDEVLAVGDAAFQSKCLRRIEELRRAGMTIVFVSHDTSAVERLCDRVFFLHQGQIRSEGSPQKVISDYYTTVVFEAARDGPSGAPLPRQRRPRSEAELVNVRFLNHAGQEIDSLATGECLVARIEYQAHQAIKDPVFELLFYSADDRLQCHYSTALGGEPLQRLEGSGTVEIRAEELGLLPGIYRIDAVLARRGALVEYDRQSRQYLLRVLPGKQVRGLFYAPHRWRLVP